MKSEPDIYSITDLQKDSQTLWEGVRNYQARNFLRQMEIGDLAFFYHSNTKPPGIVGLIKIIKNNVIDPTQFNRESPYYDVKSTETSPRWQTVVVEIVQTFPNIIPLETLKQTFTSDELILVKKGNRLSVIPVTETIAKKIINYQSLISTQ